MRLTKLVVIFFISISQGKNNPDKCHAVDLIPNFQVDKVNQILGPWYAYQVSDSMFAADCLLFSWAQNKEQNSTVIKRSCKTNNGYNETDIPVVQVGNTSGYITKINATMTRREWILGTDYKSYATIYKCQTNVPQKGYVIVLTKERQPRGQTIAKAYATLKKNGFKFEPSGLIKINQNSCTN